ncbi:MAG: phosphotransferase family protein [Dermatophilaceae bacterium]
MPHGYTNDTTGDGVVVVKRYRGPDAEVRWELERAVLMRLQGLLPVPAVLDGGELSLGPQRMELTLGFVHGAHGQDLLDDGAAAEVLHASGRVLARIHDLNVAEILPGSILPGSILPGSILPGSILPGSILPGSRVVAGEVLVHGDFGPNNLLFDSRPSQPSELVGVLDVVAVLDWEWAHVGQRVEDLAWCEWIVRTHHPDHVAALDELFAGYGARPAWAERHAAMMVRCGQLTDLCARWEPGGDGVRQWQNRAAVTGGWAE